MGLFSVRLAALRRCGDEIKVADCPQGALQPGMKRLSKIAQKCRIVLLMVSFRQAR
jgi:hypothetical protein